jgi:RNA polymerase sigma-70 factor (ECF subfamily)
MYAPPRLARVFLAALPGGVTPHEAPGLEEALAALCRRAASAWPAFHIDDDVFVTYVAERWGDEPVAAAALAAIFAADLYLACACTRGDAAAFAAFEAAHAPLIRVAVRRIDAPADRLDEAVQLTRDRLLVAAPGEAPRIGQYSGRAELAAFVRVVAVRVALSLVRERRPEDGDEALAAIGEHRDDPELAYLKHLYRAEFRAAFAVALNRLTPRDRSMLRYHIVDRLDIDRIAAIHGRPRSTIGRHLIEARARLVDETRAQLRAQLRIDRHELSSVLRLVQSSVDVSVRRLLGDEAQPA